MLTGQAESQHEKVFTVAVDEFKTNLKVLDSHLEGKSYIVGDTMTLADLITAFHIHFAFTSAINNTNRLSVKNVLNWFNSVIEKDEYKNVMGRAFFRNNPMKPK